MEELTKNQLILLALLVSFVTSIATGIATVSLMDQAPPGITQTIHRVVERTVEKVVPSENTANVITKETTIVVKEEDIVTETIETVLQSLVRINVENAEGNEIFVATGFVADSEGLVVTASSAVVDGVTYLVYEPGGSLIPMTAALQNEKQGVALLLPATTTNYSFRPVNFGSSDNLKLGQTVMALGGKVGESVGMGIIGSFEISTVEIGMPDESEDGATRENEEESEEQEVQTVQILAGLVTNISEESHTAGSPLITLFGDVVGVSKDGNGSFATVNVIRDEIAHLKTSLREVSKVENEAEEG